MFNERMADAYDRIAGDYAVINATMPATLIEFGLRFLSLTGTDAHIIDIGCGVGRDMAWLEEHGATVIGIDLSPGMLAQARSRVQGDLMQMDMRHLAFPAAHFQGAWCMAALLHLPKGEARGVLDETHRVLVPGGALHLSVQEGQGEAWEPVSYRTNHSVERFFARYTWDEANTLLNETHFRIIKSQRNDGGNRHWLQFLATAIPVSLSDPASGG